MHEGLSSEEAERQLAEDGHNTLPSDEYTLLHILFNAIKEPMFLLLIAASCLYLILGELKESLILLLMVCGTIGLTLYQEGKTEKTLQALREMSSPRALVRRDGKLKRISARELVAKDIMILNEGDRVAADAVLLSSRNFQVDESLLTGESFPISKHPISGGREALSGDNDSSRIKAGTLVVRGEATARVTATGIRSEMGQLGFSLRTLKAERSPLQNDIRQAAKYLAIGGILLSCVVTLISGLHNGDWLHAVLAGIALSMSLLPEEFPVVVAVFLALGAWRLSRVHVLTRHLPAIETLGAISVLCTDKTGTLTENRMAVKVVLPYKKTPINVDDHVGHADEVVAIAEMAFLASKPQPFDPMEKAFHALAMTCPANHQPDASQLIREYPLSADMPVMSNAWQGQENNTLIAAKGAPEAIARLCHLGEDELKDLHHQLDIMAGQGLRVLAVARGYHSGPLPVSQTDFNLKFAGVLGLSDPLRREIPAAIAQCKRAGVRVIMITGDHQATAEAIARQAGMAGGDILSGSDIERLADDALRLRLRNVNICARITPPQKLRIVQALKAEGDIVAMTGDGVNDAPALKAAHVGIAMGSRGTDVAREAAAIVLLDDNFASIIHGIALGRRIFLNMQNAMSYIISIHVPIAGLALLTVLAGWPILMYPMHIAFLELIIDPACSLAFENQAADPDIMQRNPRSPADYLFSQELLARALIQGIGALMVIGLTYGILLNMVPEGEARAMGFTVLVVINLSLIFSNLSRIKSAIPALLSRNYIPVLVSSIAITLLLCCLYIPVIREAFRFSPLNNMQLGFAFAIGCVGLLWFEGVKRLLNRKAISRLIAARASRRNL